MPFKYLAHYSPHLQNQVKQLIAEQKLDAYLQSKYPDTHAVKTDKALYQYATELKKNHLKNAPNLDKVQYDNSIGLTHRALGLNTAISRVQGGKLVAAKEIRIASLFKNAPAEFLKMIVVHELAHLKERNHDKAFYKLCLHMQPDYHQVEFDVRVYLTGLDVAKQSLA
ncbi:MAG: M48 family metallopeptidase [Formosimonas sp.]|jgi:predicted metal-dependent hydrolase